MKKSEGDRSARRGAGVSFPLAIWSLVMIMVLFSSSAASGQDIQAQGQPVGGNVQVGGSPPVQPAQQSGPYQHAGDQLIDAQEFGEDGSLGTIPPSAALPDADWVFEIPVDVQGISQEARFIYIYSVVYMSELNEESGLHTPRSLGSSRKTVELENGAYQGDVLVGVNKRRTVTDAEAGQVAYANIKLYLCTDIDCSTFCLPSTDPNKFPAFCRMNPDRPFRTSYRVEFNNQ